MTRRSALLLALALVAVTVAGLAYRRLSKPEAVAEGVALSGVVPTEGDRWVAAIYFPSAAGLLEPEMREAPANLEPAERRLWLAEQLAAGPKTDGLRPALPPGTTVAGVYNAPDGTLYLDFTVSQTATGMGSTEELLSLYSLVNTLLLDDPAANRAIILINGRQRETLAGHVDTTRPLTARPDLVREAG